MKQYTVELTFQFVVDVIANSREEAIDLAKEDELLGCLLDRANPEASIIDITEIDNA